MLYRRRHAAVLISAVAAALIVAACDSEPGEPSPTPSASASATASTTPAATASPTASPAASKPTEVIRYVPPRPDESATQNGSCFAHSIALSWREDAYRCTFENAIQDPCFRLPDGAVVCGADPTRETASPFRLSLTVPLPATPLSAAQIEAGKRNAWLVKLADGTVCGFLTGATGGFEGQRLNYGCTDRTFILGDLVPNTTWTARFVTGSVGPNGFQVATSEIRALATIYQ